MPPDILTGPVDPGLALGQKECQEVVDLTTQPRHLGRDEQGVLKQGEKEVAVPL